VEIKMINDPQDDLLDLIRQACAKAVREKRSAILVDEVGGYNQEVFELSVRVNGHDLWNIGLNSNHDRKNCDWCNK
jgi:hypothetical protein